MPPIDTSTGGRLRRILLVIVLAAIAGGMYAFVHVGDFLVQEDPLEKADAIYVLAGTRMLRPLEGADLYLAGYAPQLVMTRETPDAGVSAVAARGHVLPSDVERARDVFRSIGVPADAIIIPDRIHNSTAAEAITLRELAARHGWRRVIVVTSKFHLRRAAFAMRKELRGTGVRVIMRASRYDPAAPERWWTRREEIKWVASEVGKLIAYVVGMGA